MPKKWSALALWLLLCPLAAQPALASGLQASPVTITLQDRSGIIWLSNTADAALGAQIRIYRWTQDGEGEQLVPTDRLLASPPQVSIEPGERQLVRLVLVAPVESCEETYRLIVDELPASDNNAGSGIRYRMRYSIPVFAVSRACQAIEPSLALALESAGETTRLIATNDGNQHARLSQLAYIDPEGKRTEIHPGLVGYVLPGARMAFTLASPAQLFAGGGQIEVTVNGAKISQTLPLAAASQ